MIFEMKTLVLTTPHVTGRDVVKAQRLLKTNPYGKFYSGPIDGDYGVLSAQAAYRAKWHLGYSRKSCDHVFGDVLASYLYQKKRLTLAMRLRRKVRSKPRPKKQTLSSKAFLSAIRFIGVKENPPGSNDQMFGAWYGENGVPWCAEFVSYNYHSAGSSFKYAYVPYIVADARAGRNGLVALHSSQVRQGDVVCFDWNGDGLADHVGLFDKWIDSKTFATVEGNTSSDANGDQSNGGEVCRKERYVSNVAQFVRVTK